MPNTEFTVQNSSNKNTYLMLIVSGKEKEMGNSKGDDISMQNSCF